jgi:Outer membrane protein beta-barrel family/Carboxypeptidase regulatory-like domain
MEARCNLILSILLAHTIAAFGQRTHEIRGVVTDTKGAPLPGATIRACIAGANLTVISQPDGHFLLNGSIAGYVDMLVTSTGYESMGRRVVLGAADTLTTDTFRLSKDFYSLDTVIVSSGMPIILKGDTVEYRAEAYELSEGDMVEDLIKRFPGITVDNAGQITAQGKKISKITVNGKDFFGDDMLVANRNLPSEIVKNIQIIQDYGPDSKLTGAKSGQPITILNINTLEEKNVGQFGQVSAGIGTLGRYQTEAFANEFNKDETLGIAGAGNNIAPGVGISNQQTLGVNYGDHWSKKLSGNGNYAFAHSDNELDGNNVQRSFFPNSSTMSNNSDSSIGRTTSHNLNYTFTYSPDKSNTVIVNARLNNSASTFTSANGFEIDQSDSLDTRISEGHSILNSTGHFSNLGADIGLVHIFRKAGRSLSLNASLDDSRSSDSNRIINYSNIILNDSPGVYIPFRQNNTNMNGVYSRNIRIGYVEPINNASRFVLNAAILSSRNESHRSTYNADTIGRSLALVDSLSDQYNFSQTTAVISVGIVRNSKRLDFTLGLSLQPVELWGLSVAKKLSITYRALTLNPTASFTYRVGKTIGLNTNYSVGTNLPGLTQLRPVTDLSNPGYPVTGNPNLRPSYSHIVSLGLNKTNPMSGAFFSWNINGNETQNSIVTNVTNVLVTSPSAASPTIQETNYINSNGAYALNSSYNYSKPLLGRLLMASLTGGLSYNNNISFINNVKSINANSGWNQAAQLLLSVPQESELCLNVMYSSNKTDYRTATAVNTTIKSLHIAFNGKSNLLKHWLVGYEFSKIFNSGYSGAVNSNPTVANLSLERGLFRRKIAYLKLQCYNLLNQNSAIARAIAGNTITDTQTKQNGRFFMIGCNVRFNTFSEAKK